MSPAAPIHVVLLLLPWAVACTSNAAPNEPPPHPAATARVIFHLGERDVELAVELAITDEQRQRGLMHRRHLPRDRGMLFLFSRSEVHSFWMKNTYIPLDMVHLDEAGVVVGVVADALPLTLESRSIREPSRYVLEINGGLAAELGIAPGVRTTLLDVPAL